MGTYSGPVGVISTKNQQQNQKIIQVWASIVPNRYYNWACIVFTKDPGSNTRTGFTGYITAQGQFITV